MGVTVAVARVALNTSTGTQDITTTDLGGLTPKAVRLIATRCVTSGTAADGAGLYVGASDGTNEWTQGYEEQHNQATMDNEMEQDTTANRILTIYDGTADDVVEATIDFDSFITNGVRINITDAPAAAYLITAEFFAGSDLSVHVGTQTLGNTANALIAITSVGFEADVVLFQLMEGTATNTGSIGMGVAHNNRSGTVTQRNIAYGQRNTFASSAVNAVMRNDSCISRMIETSGNLDWSGSAQTFDSQGWDIQLANSRSPSNHHVGWIALRFGSSPVVSSKVYTYSTPTSTGSNTDSGAGFQPQYVMYLATRTAVANTSETDADGGPIGVVMADEDGDVYTQSIASEDGAADSNTQSLSNNSLNLTTHTGAAGQAASFTSFGGTGITWNWTGVDATARQWAALAIQAVASAQTITVNQISETDTAQAITRQKAKAVGQPSETDLAQAISRSKIKAIGQISETDQALAITPAKRVVLGQVVEVDTVFSISSRKFKAVAQVNETDAAQAIAPQRAYPVGQASETDTPHAITSRKIMPVTAVTETDAAQAVTAERRYAVAQTSESDAAQAITSRKIKAVGQASEIDAAQSLGTQQIISVSQATESDAAQTISRSKRVPVGQAQETDAAQPFTRIKIIFVQLVTETELAQALFPRKRVAVAQAIEIDLAQAIARSKHKAIGQATETDFAQSITELAPIVVLLGQVVETDSALAISGPSTGPAAGSLRLQEIAVYQVIMQELMSHRVTLETIAYEVYLREER